MSLQPPRPRPPSSSSSCARHHVTGLCATCLRERLALLEPSPHHNDHANSNGSLPPKPRLRRDDSAGLTRLRRSNSFSVQQDGVPVVLEPQRRSCDVRVRSLNHQHDHLCWEGDGCGTTVSGGAAAEGSGLEAGGSASQQGEGEKQGRDLPGGATVGEGGGCGSTVSGGVAAEGSTVAGGAAAEVRALNSGNPICGRNQQGEGDGRESTVSGGDAVDGGGLSSGVLEQEVEIQEEEEEEEEEEEGEVRVEIEGGVVTRSDFEEVGVKKMKDHINSDGRKNPAPDKGSSAIPGSFRHAASAFGKKLQKWRGKKKVSGGAGGGPMEGTGGRDEKPGSWHRALDAQSEMADCGYGRRSCDTDLPRFSLDAGRMSMDAPRRSFDNPRASWDGFLIGGRALYRPAMMGAVVEDCPVMIARSDNKIPVEDSMNLINEDPDVPGGSVQTRDYYLDSSSSQRRRRSFERSRSVRRAGGVVADETNSGSISKVSPAMTDYLHRNRIADSRVPIPNLSSSSVRDDRSESFESVYRDIPPSRSSSKKGGWWSKSLSILGLIQRRSSSNKDDDNGNDDKRSHRSNVVERSMSETWRSEVSGELRGVLDRKSFHGNSTSGSRNSFSYNAFGSGRNPAETKMNGLKRNQSARYASSTVESKLLQLNSAQHRKGSQCGGLGKSGSMNSESSAKSGLWMFGI